MLLTGVFRRFTFNVIVDTVELKSTILLFAFYVSHLFFVLDFLFIELLYVFYDSILS